MAFEGVSVFLNETISNLYLDVVEQVPGNYRFFMLIALYTIIIAIYGIFIWKFYKFLAKRDIISLNLNQYNKSNHPFFSKFFAAVYFLIEYIIILPIIVFFWFAVLAVFLLVLSNSKDIGSIILIAAAVVASTRLTSYFSGELSKEIAKLLPLTMLAVFLMQPDFFSVGEMIARFSDLPLFFGTIFNYLLFIIILEIIMRGLYTLVDLSTDFFERE